MFVHPSQKHRFINARGTTGRTQGTHGPLRAPQTLDGIADNFVMRRS